MVDAAEVGTGKGAYTSWGVLSYDSATTARGP
jgi:hypothetical protein